VDVDIVYSEFKLIYHHSEDAGLLEGEIEVDESYFGGSCKGKYGRGAVG